MEKAESLQTLLKYARLLEAGGLPYMVVGAHAVMVHGIPRFTADLDVVVHLPFARRETLRALLEAEGCARFEERRDEFGERLAAATPEGPLLEVFFTPPNPLYDREFERRVPVTLGEATLWFIAPEDLLLRKLVNCRLRHGNDYDDALSVAAQQGERLDAAYLRKHCAVHRVCELLERVLEEARNLAGAS